MEPTTEQKRLETLKQIRCLKGRHRFADYCEYVHEGRWIPTRFHVALCDRVQEFIESETRPYGVLVITTPPQFGKSRTVTETLPSWCLVRNPNWRIILASYGEDFAEKFGRANRNILESHGKEYGVSLAKTPSGATEFELSNHIGSVISRGMMSGITGRSAELIIIDDPIKNRQEADSETYRDRMWDEWLNSLKTRLQSGGKAILIQTRWSEQDLAGRMMDNDPYVSVWRVPCEAEDGDVLGRQVGEGLCPEIGKGTDWLRAFKESYIRDSNDGGLRAWNALYQGRPTSAEGNIVRRSWFRYYSTMGRTSVSLREGAETVTIPCIPLPSFFDKQWQSWDCTFKDGEKSDFVCGGVFGRRLADYFLLDMYHERTDIIGTMSAIGDMSKKWSKAQSKVIEEKANGSAIIAMMQHEIGGFISVNPTESKVARVNAVVPLIEGGNFYLPHPDEAKWVRGFLEEFASFPNGKNDDMVDMTSQGLKQFMFDSTDRSHEEIAPGTYVYQLLRAKGWKDNQIRKAVKDGRIKHLYGAPKGFT